MYRHIPNLITVTRFLLTVVFFVLLNVHPFASFSTTMWVAFSFFLLAAATDFLDGYLARHWKVESVFGRIVDPFVDKILVCGAFIFFASSAFLSPVEIAHLPPELAITGVVPWMVVLLIAREFLITGIRGLAESKGIDFRADWAGKIKMVVQSIAIGAILADLATAYAAAPVPWIHITRNIMIWTTLVVTTLSAIGYLSRARKLIDN